MCKFTIAARRLLSQCEMGVVNGTELFQLEMKEDRFVHHDVAYVARSTRANIFDTNIKGALMTTVTSLDDSVAITKSLLSR